MIENVRHCSELFFPHDVLLFGVQDDPDHIVQLCLETLMNGHSVLVFCATKNWCEKLAEHIAKLFRTIGKSFRNLINSFIGSIS
jgi:hypothetical protein